VTRSGPARVSSQGKKANPEDSLKKWGGDKWKSPQKEGGRGGGGGGGFFLWVPGSDRKTELGEKERGEMPQVSHER